MDTNVKKFSFEGIFRIFLMTLIIATNLSPYLLMEVFQGHRVNNPFDLSSEIKQVNFLNSNALYESFPNTERWLVDGYLLGHSAVYVFYFLSGFSVGRFLLSGKSAGEFLFWRWRKIFIPSALLLTLLYFFWLLVVAGRGSGDYFLQILSMGFDFGNGEISTPAWFLTPLFASYGIALIVDKIITNASLRKLFFVLGVMVFTSFAPVWANSDYSNYYYPAPLVAFFIGGQVLAQIKKNPYVSAHNKFKLNMEYTIIIIPISYASMSYVSSADIFSRNALRFLFAYLLILIFIFFKDSVHSHLFNNFHILNRISKSTFVVFLIHYPFFIFLYHENYFVGVYGINAFFGFLVSIFILGVFLNETLLKKLDVWLLKLDKKGF